jgi:hypothetical protein
MRIKILSIILSGALASCSQSRNSEKPIPTETASESPMLNEILHDSLTESQLKEIKRIHHVFSEVNSTLLEQKIDNFKSNQNPAREIAIWSKMADAYERFAVNKHVEEHDKKEEAYEAILLRSTMTEDEVMKKLKFTYLSQKELEEIFSYYTDSPRP